jgi:hypothetical protein
MSVTVKIDDWAEYFKDFSVKNFRRPVRLEVFSQKGALEEVKKLPLAGVYVELSGKNAPRVEILMGGVSTKEIEYAAHTVANVKSITALTDGDQAQSALEFVSADGTQTLLSFVAGTAESKTA